MIGDSFVHGACVEENQTIQGNLEQVHNRSVSLGIGGNGVGMGLGILKEIDDKEFEAVAFYNAKTGVSKIEKYCRDW